jgi:hypothetical protein
MVRGFTIALVFAWAKELGKIVRHSKGSES